MSSVQPTDPGSPAESSSTEGSQYPNYISMQALIEERCENLNISPNNIPDTMQWVRYWYPNIHSESRSSTGRHLPSGPCAAAIAQTLVMKSGYDRPLKLSGGEACGCFDYICDVCNLGSAICYCDECGCHSFVCDVCRREDVDVGEIFEEIARAVAQKISFELDRYASRYQIPAISDDIETPWGFGPGFPWDDFKRRWWEIDTDERNPCLHPGRWSVYDPSVSQAARDEWVGFVAEHEGYLERFPCSEEKTQMDKLQGDLSYGAMRAKYHRSMTNETISLRDRWEKGRTGDDTSAKNIALFTLLYEFEEGKLSAGEKAYEDLRYLYTTLQYRVESCDRADRYVNLLGVAGSKKCADWDIDELTKTESPILHELEELREEFSDKAYHVLFPFPVGFPLWGKLTKGYDYMLVCLIKSGLSKEQIELQVESLVQRERREIESLRELVKNDPEVRKAREKMKDVLGSRMRDLSPERAGEADTNDELETDMSDILVPRKRTYGTMPEEDTKSLGKKIVDLRRKWERGRTGGEDTPINVELFEMLQDLDKGLLTTCEEASEDLRRLFATLQYRIECCDRADRYVNELDIAGSNLENCSTWGDLIELSLKERSIFAEIEPHFIDAYETLFPYPVDLPPWERFAKGFYYVIFRMMKAELSHAQMDERMKWLVAKEQRNTQQVREVVKKDPNVPEARKNEKTGSIGGRPLSREKRELSPNASRINGQ
ncbi:hypothetical protein WAI453_005604 [Rhynchosporium graminicola]